MLHVHLSNRIEALADVFVQHLGGPRDDPFAAEQVVVPSLALKRWLTLRLADAHGVAAHIEFHFLAQWLWTLLRQQQAQHQQTSPGMALTPAALTWRLWRHLGDTAFVAEHPRLATYLGAEPDACRGAPVDDGNAAAAHPDPVLRLELAERCAGLLDQALTYRPDWIEAWSGHRWAASSTSSGAPATSATAREDEAWQAALWRRVASELALGVAHPLATLGELDPSSLPGSLPSSVHLFALPAMAPLHAQLLTRIARHLDVHVYALNPCREYWFELVPPRVLSHLAARRGSGAVANHEVGHALLATWGRQTQAYLDTLIPTALDNADAVVDDSLHAPLPGRSLLARLHNSILELTPPEPGQWHLDADDRSIELHRCHSLTRELEVLHDRLLGLMREAESRGELLLPGEIVVVTPDLSAAAPFIEAVFGTAAPARRLPFTITGLPQRQGSAPARVLLNILSLIGSRAAGSEVLALLQEAPVAHRFGLDDEALERIEAWLVQAGLHGGLSGTHRAALALGAEAEDRHTLAGAVRRLLLGHLLPDEQAEPFGGELGGEFGGELGCGGAEGSAALALGALARFAEALQRLERACAAPKAAPEWVELLQATLDVFVSASSDDDGHALVELRQQLHLWGALLHTAGCADAQPLGSSLPLNLPLTLPVVRRALAALLDEPAHGGVASGGITFAAMSSLRNLPFKVIAAIGLDGDAFPSRGAPLDFDLLAHAPRRGDRQRRLDERNLFLDLLLAARTHTHLSCTARSQRDNSERPASVVVEELLEFLVDALAAADASEDERQRWRARLVVDHPLQAFSLQPFLSDTDVRQRSHDAELALALQAALRQRAADALAQANTSAGVGQAEAEADEAAETPEATEADAESTGDDSSADEADAAPPVASHFFTLALPAPGPEWRELELSALLHFLRNPSRYLLAQRLHIRQPFDAEHLDDQESALLTRGAERQLAERLLPHALAGVGLPALQRLALAGPEVPASAVGRQQMGDWLLRLQDFADRVLEHAADVAPQSLTLELNVDGEPWKLHAHFDALFTGGQLLWRFGKLRVADQLQAWLQHLALCACAPPGLASTARTLWLAQDCSLVCKPVADPRTELATLLRLYQQGLSAPLPLHLRAAEAYVRGGANLEAARREWQGSDDRPGEGRDPSRALAFRGVADALAEPFGSIAQAVFTPLSQHCERLLPWQSLPALGEALVLPRAEATA